MPAATPVGPLHQDPGRLASRPPGKGSGAEIFNKTETFRDFLIFGFFDLKKVWLPSNQKIRKSKNP